MVYHLHYFVLSHNQTRGGVLHLSHNGVVVSSHFPSFLLSIPSTKHSVSFYASCIVIACAIIWEYVTLYHVEKYTLGDLFFVFCVVVGHCYVEQYLMKVWNRNVVLKLIDKSYNQCLPCHFTQQTLPLILQNQYKKIDKSFRKYSVELDVWSYPKSLAFKN